MPTVSLGERQSGQRRGGKPAHESPGAATAGRLGSEGITPPRLPAPSSPSPSPFPRRRAGAGAAPLAPRPPGPARPASLRLPAPGRGVRLWNFAGKRNLAARREDEKVRRAAGRGGAAAGAGRGGRGAQVGARGRVGARAAAERQVPRAGPPRGAGRPARPRGRAAGRPGRGRPPLRGSGRASPFSPARGGSLLRGAGRVTVTRERRRCHLPLAQPSPAGGVFCLIQVQGAQRLRGGGGGRSALPQGNHF